MKYEINDKYRHIGVTAFLVVAASLLFYYGIFHMQSLLTGIRKGVSILSPLIYGFGIAYLLIPIVNFLEDSVIFPIFEKNHVKLQKNGIRWIRWICVILSALFFLFVIIALMMMILPQLIQSITGLIYSFPSYVSSMQKWINSTVADLSLRPQIQEQITDTINQAQEFLTNNLLPQLQELLQNVTSGVFDVLVFLKNFLIGLIISLYVMADKETFVAKAKMVTYALLPGKQADFLIRSMRYTHRTFGGFISGKLLDSAIIGILCYIGTSLIGTPYALLVSVIVGVTNIVPFFGPYFGSIPCLFLVLLVDPLQSLYFLIFILILQQFDGNILGPKILGDSTGMSSFMVIVAILIGGGFFGVPGMILGVPVFAVIQAAFWKVIGRYLRGKDMPYKEESYVNIDRVNLKTGDIIELKDPVQRKSASERHNAFMLFWNAFMTVLIPILKVIWAVLVKAMKFLGTQILRLFRLLMRLKARMDRLIREFKDAKAEAKQKEADIEAEHLAESDKQKEDSKEQESHKEQGKENTSGEIK